MTGGWGGERRWKVKLRMVRDRQFPVGVGQEGLVVLSADSYRAASTASPLTCGRRVPRAQWKPEPVASTEPWIYDGFPRRTSRYSV